MEKIEMVQGHYTKREYIERYVFGMNCDPDILEAINIDIFHSKLEHVYFYVNEKTGVAGFDWYKNGKKVETIHGNLTNQGELYFRELQNAA